MVDKTLLQVLMKRENFDKLNGTIHLSRFGKETRAILNGIRSYYKKYAHDEVNMELLSQKFFIDVPCSDVDAKLYTTVFAEMTKEPDPEIAKELTRNLRVMEFDKRLEELRNEYVMGKEVDLYDGTKHLLEEFERDIKQTATDDYCQADVQAIIEDHNQGSNLDWKLRCLYESMPHLRTGMQIIVGMRPGRGKTSFCADNGVHWLGSPLVRDTGRPIVWFNNEGTGIRIKGSFLRSALGMDFDQISSIGWEEANRRFAEITGRGELLRIYDVHGRDTGYIERILEKDKPCVVFWDMLDSVRCPSLAAESDRTDQKLERLYQWARECAVKHDFLSIPTSQVSVDGSGMQWIPASCLKDSKTGKQGACDAIITIGTNQKPGFESSRYIYVPKAFKGSPIKGASPACNTEVVFNPSTCRYMNAKTN